MAPHKWKENIPVIISAGLQEDKQTNKSQQQEEKKIMSQWQTAKLGPQKSC